MHPGEAGVEPGAQELQRVAALGVMRRQELGHLRPEGAASVTAPFPV